MKLRSLNIFFSLLKHLVAAGAVIASWLTLAKFYLVQFPPIGADFYQYVNFTAYIKNFLTWPWASWKGIWFSGHPTFFDYGLIHSYLTLPLTRFFTDTDASRFYLIGTLGAYLVFAYFLFWELSKNRVFSVALAVAVTWSYNLYVGLYFGGTAGYAATQMFLPLVMYLVVKYYRSRKEAYLFLASFFLGLSFWGHTGITTALIFIPCLIVLFFWKDQENKFFSLKKIRDIFLFAVPALLIGLFVLYPTFYSILNVSQEQASGVGFGFSSNPYPEALADFIKSSNFYIFIALGFAFILIFILKRFRHLNESLTFFLLAVYLFTFEWLYTIGRNPIANAIGPDRTYFALTLALAGLLAALFKSLGESFYSFRELRQANKGMRLSLYLKLGLIGILFFSLFQIDSVKETIAGKMGSSSLMPVEVNEVLVKNREELLKEIVPSWLETDDKNHRLYEINNSVNIWWNIIYDLPIVKGYFPVMPSQNAVNWLYWADQTFIGEIVEHFNTPEEVAKNSALFLIDWYGVKYMDDQGEPFDIADYLREAEGFVKNEVKEEGKIKFVEVGEKLTSPIASPTNSPTLLVIADDFSYDTVLRILAMENLNSKIIIPLNGGHLVDILEKENLSHFDGILLYNYQYKSRGVWAVLENYVRSGGNLMIETGSEVKESDTKNLKGSDLPDIFPVKKTTRDELGRVWALEQGELEEFEEIKTAEFSPPLYNNSPWKISFSTDSEVRPWAQVILRQQGKPIVVRGDLGEGKVIWSGMNLLYHIQTYQNFEESNFFKVLLDSLLNLKEKSIPAFEFSREKPEEVKIAAENFSGALLKESYFAGWQGLAGSEKLKVYKAGLDFMYVRMPGSEKEVTFVYRGSGWYLFMVVLGLVAVLFLLAAMIFGSKIFKKAMPNIGMSKKVKKWWDKDEEE